MEKRHRRWLISSPRDYNGREERHGIMAGCRLAVCAQQGHPPLIWSTSGTRRPRVRQQQRRGGQQTIRVARKDSGAGPPEASSSTDHVEEEEIRQNVISMPPTLAAKQVEDIVDAFIGRAFESATGRHDNRDERGRGSGASNVSVFFTTLANPPGCI